MKLSSIFDKYKTMNKAAKASLWFLFVSFLQKGSIFITTALFTRIMSPESYGITTVYATWLVILTPILTLNVASSGYNKSMLEHNDDIDRFTSSILFLEFLSSIFFLIIFLIFRTALSNLLGIPVWLILYMFVFIIFEQAFLIWTMQQRFKFKYVASTIVTLIVSIGGPLLAFFILQSGVFNDQAATKIICSSLLTLIFGVALFVIFIFKGKCLINKKYWTEVLKLSLPLIPHVLSMNILSGADKIMISKMISNEAAAIYSVAYSISSVVYIFWTAIDSSFMPWTLQKFKAGETDKIRKYSKKVFVIYCILCLIPICIAPEILYLLGSEKYMEGIWCMAPAILGVMFLSLYCFYVNIEYAIGKTLYVMIGSVIAAGINLGLNFIFIPLYGYVAAAYTTLFSYILLALIHCLIVTFVLKQKIYDSIFLFVTLGILTAFILVFQLTYTQPIARYIVLGVLIILLIIFRKKLASLLSFKDK